MRYVRREDFVTGVRVYLLWESPCTSELRCLSVCVNGSGHLGVTQV